MKIIKTKDFNTFCQMIGANLRYCRNNKKITQKSTGERIDITHQQIAKYESGVSCCSAYRLNQMARIYEVPVSKLLDPDFIMNECNKKRSFEETVSEKEFHKLGNEGILDEQIEKVDYEHERRILKNETA